VNRRLPVDKVDLREPCQEALEKDLNLKPGQRCAQAMVWSGSERERDIVLAVDVETVGLRKTRRVPIRRPDQKHDGLARSDVGAPDNQRLDRGAESEMGGPVEPQHLLDRGPDQFRSSPDSIQYIVVAEEGDEAIANQPACGWKSRGKKKDGVAHQLVGGELVRRVREPDHVAQQVAFRVRPPPLDQAREILLDRSICRGRPNPRLAGRTALEGRHAGSHEGPQLGAVLGVDANDIAAHRDRHRYGEIFHHVDLALEAVEDPVHDLDNTSSHRFDLARAKWPPDDISNAPVLRGVFEDDDAS
jgi:hypothetical protein